MWKMFIYASVDGEVIWVSRVWDQSACAPSSVDKGRKREGKGNPRAEREQRAKKTETKCMTTLKGSQITAQIDDLGGNFVFTDQIS
jgi:hypothetical protein